nr:unnamed protein product [Digitaria exilis]
MEDPHRGMDSLDLNSQAPEFPHIGAYQSYLQDGMFHVGIAESLPSGIPPVHGSRGGRGASAYSGRGRRGSLMRSGRDGLNQRGGGGGERGASSSGAPGSGRAIDPSDSSDDEHEDELPYENDVYASDDGHEHEPPYENDEYPSDDGGSSDDERKSSTSSAHGGSTTTGSRHQANPGGVRRRHIGLLNLHTYLAVATAAAKAVVSAGKDQAPLSQMFRDHVWVEQQVHGAAEFDVAMSLYNVNITTGQTFYSYHTCKVDRRGNAGPVCAVIVSYHIVSFLEAPCGRRFPIEERGCGGAQ